MCEFCTREDITSAAIFKYKNEEYRGEHCQIHFIGKDGGIVPEGEKGIPHLCLFTRTFQDKAAIRKISYCPWCGEKLD